MKKILHITNWYPNKWNDIEAIFIKEQFDLFSKTTDAKLLHVEVRYHKKKWYKFERVQYSENEIGYYISTRIKSFRIIEIFTTYLLIKALRKENFKKYSALHFHIAYPLLTYIHKFKKLLKKPVLISEHWSAFHYNFFMPKTTKKLNRIKNIFKQNTPLITVSKALLNDIQQFAGGDGFPSLIIPNVIDYKTYKYVATVIRANDKLVFFIVNYWREIKNPLPMLDAFVVLHQKGIDFELRVGGYGDYLAKIKSHVEELQLSHQVKFLGKMNKKQIALQMSEAHAYLFSSKYETFSAVCAQALCCGCPLIGPPIPAILEYASCTDMINLKTDDVNGWVEALVLFSQTHKSFNREEIADKAQFFLNHEKIQQQYLSFLP